MDKNQKLKIMKMFEDAQTPYDEFIKHYILEETLTKDRLCNIKSYLAEIRNRKEYYQKLSDNWKKEQ